VWCNALLVEKKMHCFSPPPQQQHKRERRKYKGITAWLETKVWGVILSCEGHYGKQ
jgi:hypothetical protein